MKTVMILGAGKGQLPFIEICKHRGYQTIVVSPKGDFPGFSLADKAYFFDTRDKDSILRVALKEKIDAITTDQTDVSVPTVAYVAEKMGLPGIGSKLAKQFTDKYEMRKAAAKAGIAVPDFMRARNLSEALCAAEKIGYPLIIKPVNSSGSRGVYKIASAQDLNKKYSESSAFDIQQEIIVEKFIDGIEYLADGFAMNGEYHTLDIGTKEYFDLPGCFVSKMCMFVSAKRISQGVEKKVFNTNEALIRALQLPFGITHAEYIYSPTDKKVYLVECAARGGGVFLSSHLTPWASGFKTNEALIDYLLESKCKVVDPERLSNKISAWLCFGLPSGRIVDITGCDKLNEIPGIRKICLDDIYPGKETCILRDDTNKYGPILFCDDSEESIMRAINEVKNVLKININTENGLKGIIW